MGINNLYTPDPLTLGAIVVLSGLFGWMLIRQGAHKRDIIAVHTFRVFHVVWKKRVLEHKAGPVTETPHVAQEPAQPKKTD